MAMNHTEACLGCGRSLGEMQAQGIKIAFWLDWLSRPITGQSVVTSRHVGTAAQEIEPSCGAGNRAEWLLTTKS